MAYSALTITEDALANKKNLNSPIEAATPLQQQLGLISPRYTIYSGWCTTCS
jgi:hypothetical protein